MFLTTIPVLRCYIGVASIVAIFDAAVDNYLNECKCGHAFFITILSLHEFTVNLHDNSNTIAVIK